MNYNITKADRDWFALINVISLEEDLERKYEYVNVKSFWNIHQDLILTATYIKEITIFDIDDGWREANKQVNLIKIIPSSEIKAWLKALQN